MRVFNVRLAAILLGIAVVLGVGVGVLHSVMVQRNASFFKVESENAERRAAKAAKSKDADLEEKEMKDAIKYLGWYTQLMPRDYKALEHLGILWADKAQKGQVIISRQAFGIALDTLEKTVRLAPERTVARKRLVAMAMLPQVRRYQDAKDHLERFLLVDAPKDADLLEQLADCQIGLKVYDQARETLKKSIAAKPAQFTAYGKLAELLRYRLANPKEAEQWMTKLVKVNAKSAKAHYFRAAYLADPRLHRDDEALEEARKAIKLAPDDPDILLLAAERYMAKRDFDNARKCLTHGIELEPSSVAMHSNMFQLEQRAGKREKAVAVLQEGLKATDRAPILLWLMADALVDANKLDESRKILDELRTKSFPGELIEYVDARIEFVQKHWKAAMERFNDIRGALISEPRYARYVPQLDFSLACCYLELGERELEEESLRRVLAVDPLFGPAKKMLADISQSKGDYGETLKGFQDLYKSGRLDATGKIRFLQLLFLNMTRQKPEQRDWKPLEKLLDVVEKSVPDSPDIPLLRAQVLVSKGRFADAEKLLLKTRDKYPKQLAPWGGLIRLAIHDKDWDKADGLLADAETALGDSVDLRLLHAQYLLIRGGLTVAARLPKLADNDERFSEDERLRLWKGLLDFARMVDDKKLAASLGQKIADKDPNNAQVRYIRFEQAVNADDAVAAEKALKDVELVAGRNYYWYYGQAVLLCMRAKNGKEDTGPLLAQALDYLNKARELRKDWSRVPMIEGSIYDMQGKTELALQSFQEAIELGDRNPVSLQRAIRLLFQAQRYADVERLIGRLAADGRPLPTVIMQSAAECAMRMKNLQRALERTKKAVPADSQNGKDLVWLGQMLGVVGRAAKDQGQSAAATELLDEAEKALQRAVELEPKLSLARKALVQFYALTGSQDKAEAAIQDFKGNLADKELLETSAYCYEVIGNIDAAQEQYEAMLKAAPQDMAAARLAVDFYHHTNRAQPAEALLQGLLDAKPPLAALDVAWARRELARFLGGSGNYAELQKAVKLVDQNLSSPQASLADQQLIARLMASDIRRSGRDEAIRRFESMGGAAMPDDRFALAMLYHKAGDWIKAGDILRSLVASHGGEPRYLEFYMDALIEHQEMSSAKNCLDRLERIAPNSFGTISRKADLLCATNQQAKAFEVLKDFVDNVDAEPRDRGLRLRMVAEKLVALAARLTKQGQAGLAAKGIELAESLFRSFAKENPGQELVLAAFLGQHGKIDEALSILDDSLQICTIGDFVQACSLIFRDGTATKEQLQRLSDIMQSAEKKFERATPLLLVTADLRVRQGLDSEAIDLYHEVLKKSADEAFAMNNLAVLQALQGVKLDESLKLVNRALELAGPRGAILDSRGTVYLAMKNAEKAIADMNDAIADSPDPDRLFHRAQAYALVGDKASAKKDMDAALKKGLTKAMLQPLEAPEFEKLQQSLR